MLMLMHGQACRHATDPGCSVRHAEQEGAGGSAAGGGASGALHARLHLDLRYGAGNAAPPPPLLVPAPPALLLLRSSPLQLRGLHNPDATLVSHFISTSDHCPFLSSVHTSTTVPCAAAAGSHNVVP